MKNPFAPAGSLLALTLGLLAFGSSSPAHAQNGAAKSAAAAAPSAATVFVGARLIDGTGGTPVEDSVLVVQDGRIAAVGAMHEVKAPPGAEIVSLKGKTIIPGLISAHSHLGVTKLNTIAPENFSQENVSAQLMQYERYGVTAVMSLGLNGDVLYSWRDQQRQGKFPGADIFTADRGIGVPRAVPPQTVGLDQIYRPATVEEARKEVQEIAARHPDIIKIWLDDLFGTVPKMNPDIFPAVIDEAHKNGLRVASHVFYLEDAKVLLKNGVNVLAHSVRDKPVDPEFIAAMKEHEVAYIPTLALDESQFIYAEHPKWMDEPAFTRAVDPSLLTLWTSPEYSSKMAANPNTPKNKAAAAMGQKNVKTLFDAGVVVAMGTDSGGLPTRIQGFGEHRELQLLVQSGLTPMDALVCATRNAATVIGDDKNRGTLEVGKRADFVVLDANPLDDIRNTTQISAVWHGGNPVTVVVKANATAAAGTR